MAYFRKCVERMIKPLLGYSYFFSKSVFVVFVPFNALRETRCYSTLELPILPYRA